MAAFADLLANAVTFTSGDRVYKRLELLQDRFGDVAYDDGVATDAIHSLATSTQTSGNMTLTFTLGNGETFTTGNIAFDAVAATVETAIDSAATTASITDWTNGDISVAGTAVNNGPLTFTFDGDSVSGTQPATTVLTDVDGAGGAWGAVSVTEAGQTARPARQVLHSLGLLSGSMVAQGATTAVTAGGNFREIALLPEYVLRKLAEECAIEDTNANVSDATSKAIEKSLLDAFSIIPDEKYAD